MRGGYLRQFVAIFCRLADALTCERLFPRGHKKLSSSRCFLQGGSRGGFFSYFVLDTYQIPYFMVLACSDECNAFCCGTKFKPLQS
jgi:hypothetical protein